MGLFALLVGAFVPTIGLAEGPPITIGAKVTLYAVADGTPAPNFTWKKDGVIVVTGNGVEVKGERGDIIVITSFKPENEGTYVVYATNIAGTANSADEVLTITQGGVPVERARTELRTFTYDYHRESKTKTVTSSGLNAGTVRGPRDLEFRFVYSRTS